MANEAPDERAAALAARLMGRDTSREAMSTIVKGMKTAPEADQDDGLEADDDLEEEEGQVDDDDQSDDYNEEEDDADDTDEVAGEEEDDGDDESEGDGYYSDDDTMLVMVDGEEKEVSIRDLKKAYSGEGAIEKRLQEATEARKQAQSERQQAATEVNTYRNNFMRTIQQLDSVLFMPMIAPPDPSLRMTNMAGYLMQKDAYEEDQQRIANTRQHLAGAMMASQQAADQQRAQFRAQEQQRLLEKMPELKNPKTGPKVQKDIMDAAAYYGFTPAQVADVDHAGLFLMARDAGRWLNMQKLKREGKVPTDRETGKKVVRKLRSGGGASAKTRAVATQKEQQVAEKRARASGKVDDVANLLMSKARTTGKPNGRRS